MSEKLKEKYQSSRWAILAALSWGFAEGIFLFLVPDILLSVLALRGWRVALYSTLAVVVGACVAAVFLTLGLQIYGEPFAQVLKQIWEHLPGFREPMLKLADEHLTAGGARGLTFGPSSGIPYRIYVVEAWRNGVPLTSLLAWTPLARLERIAIAPIAVLAIRIVLFRWLLKNSSELWQRRASVLFLGIIGIYWICLYGWYWFLFLPRAYP